MQKTQTQESDELNSHVDSVAMSTPEYLNCFQSGFTLIPMKWTGKKDFDADLFDLV